MVKVRLGYVSGNDLAYGTTYDAAGNFKWIEIPYQCLPASGERITVSLNEKVSRYVVIALVNKVFKDGEMFFDVRFDEL